MKNVLVISDNHRLTEFFQNECQLQNLESLTSFSYKYSSKNKKPSKMMELGASAIDLNKSSDLEYAKNNFNLIFSLHCKQIFPSELVSTVTCINVHPGFNPYNRGWYPQVFSIINGYPIGATIHLMDDQVDHGPILAQSGSFLFRRVIHLFAQVYEKVIIIAEKNFIKENLHQIPKKGNFNIKIPKLEGNQNSLEDFRKICRLDLQSIGSLEDHIKLLRALSHAEFKNAYFVSEEGKKVFIRIILDEAFA